MYGEAFFELEGMVAAQSAAVVVPWVLEETKAKTVVDFGCGTGAWLAAAKEHGCEVVGIDQHVPEKMLLIDQSEFRRRDLATEYIPALRDLAICVEVAEHLPPEAGETLVRGLTMSEGVLFSAATPGQSGIGHINCRPHDYWHGLFERWGFQPEFIGDKFTEPVADFYRRNLYLYRPTT